MKHIVWFIGTVLLLILLEAARVYFIMPFPGSQLDDAANVSRVEVAYRIHQNIGWMRVLGLLALFITAVRFVRAWPTRWANWLTGGLVVVYLIVLYMVNGQMMADQMFLQPKNKRMVLLHDNKVPMNKLVLGVLENGDARAYPLQVIGYHHQVRDTVGGQPLMITYCTVCRTGRVFDAVVNGQPETFRLVGMDHFNAMFEDERTGSWWRQATGEAILGPQKGQALNEHSARQMTLAEWAAEHPTTLVLQADPAFKEEIDSLGTYDLGVKRGKLTGRDFASWHNKSWVVGVTANKADKAFDWNALVKQRIINDSVGGQPVVLALAPDKVSFGVFSRIVGDQRLTFTPAPNGQFTDRETGTVWSRAGVGLSGPLIAQRLEPVRAYQEFWHSWRSFHPRTERAH